MNQSLTRLYYNIRPFIPRSFQIGLRRRMAARKRSLYVNSWPIDFNSGDAPQGWAGWPDGKRFALVLSHDVDTQVGVGLSLIHI